MSRPYPSMTDTPDSAPSPFPPDVAALIDEAYAQGLDFGPDLERSTMRLLRKDRTVVREVHWAGVGAWAQAAIAAALKAVP